MQDTLSLLTVVEGGAESRAGCCGPVLEQYISMTHKIMLTRLIMAFIFMA